MNKQLEQEGQLGSTNAPQGRNKRADIDYSAEFSDNLPAILKQLNISLAFTSYQAGRLMLVRSDGENIDINFKSFHRPMGLTVTEDSLTLGVYTQVVKFQREDGLLAKIKRPLQRIEDDKTAPRIKLEQPSEELAEQLDAEASPESGSEQESPQAQRRAQQQAQLDNLYQPVDERVDACYITRSSHFSGMINIHDVEWGDAGLWAVNSSFSCLCTLEPDHSFVPRWKPYFISDLVPEDRCHLNGMTLKDGKPAYVTTFSTENKASSWRNKPNRFEGTLMCVEQNKILVDGLVMPHSPRWYNDKVYFCNSGLGQICSYDPATEQVEVIAEVQGFTRGMDFCGPLMFVGLSKVRMSDVSRPAPLAEKYTETFSGIWIINLEDNSIVGQISFTGNVDQIYDVAVLPNTHFPELIEPNHPRMRNHFSYPRMSELKDL